MKEELTFPSLERLFTDFSFICHVRNNICLVTVIFSDKGVNFSWFGNA